MVNVDPMGNIKWKKKVPPNVGKQYDIKTPVVNSCGSSFVGCKHANYYYISQKIVPNSKLPSHCKVQILSNHRIKWHILLSHVANQFLRHLSCMSGLPRSHLGTGLQCLGEVHLVRDHVASAEGIKANWRIYFLNT